MTPDYSRPFGGKWSADMSTAPHDGSTFLGRLNNTNRSFAVRWVDDAWYRAGPGDHLGPQDIIEWISFKDYADTRFCVWNGGENCNVPAR